MYRILEIVYGNAGGLEYYAKRLSEFLEEQGHQVTFLTSRLNPSEKLGIRSITLPAIPKSRILNKLFFNVLIWLERKKLNREFDIIHIHGDNGTFLSRSSKKTILTIHGSSWQRLASMKKNQMIRLTDFATLFGLLLSGAFERYAYSRTDYVVCVSNFSKNFHNRFFRRGNVYVIPPGIEEPETVTEDNTKLIGFTKRKINIIWIGGDAKKKGLEVSIEAVRNLNSAALIIVGNIRKPENLPDNCTFLGRVSTEQLSSVWKTVDIVILPSIYEGFPTVLLEAMSYGVVPMTYDEPPYTEILDSKSSVLVKRKEKSIFRDKLIEIAEDVPETLEEKKKECLVRARSYLNDVVFKDYLEIISDNK